MNTTATTAQISTETTQVIRELEAAIEASKRARQWVADALDSGELTRAQDDEPWMHGRWQNDDDADTVAAVHELDALYNDDPEIEDPAWSDPAYLAWQEEMERQCGAAFTTAGTDPYGTTCDLDKGHYPATPHEGDDPLTEGERVRWTGGGMCAGDPLPYGIVSWSKHGIRDEA